MLLIFLMLVKVTGVFGNVTCDHLEVINPGEVKEWLNPNYPFSDGPDSKCRWTYVAEEDKRVIFVCPFNEGIDKRTDARELCAARMNVVDDGRIPADDPYNRPNCRDLTFAAIGVNNRITVNYINDGSHNYNRTSGFKCFVYADFKSRWDSITSPSKKDLAEVNPSAECDFHIKLNKNEIVRLVTGKYSGDGWQKCRWRAVAPIGSQIALTCPFTHKPPEPLTSQVVPCDSEFDVTTELYEKTVYCNQRSFSISSTNHEITLVYKTNVSVPQHQFDCYFHWKSPNDDKSESITEPLPYENCDHYMEIKVNQDVYSPNYPEEVQPGTACRWTVEAPKNYRIGLYCLYPNLKIEQEMPCLSEFNLELGGGNTSLHCHGKEIYAYSVKNWLTINYKNPSNNPVAAFKCFVWVEAVKPEIQCVQCPACCENCDKLIKLRKGEVRQLLSPNYRAMEPAGSTCRWTVVADKDRRVVLTCPFYHPLDTLGPEYERPCNGILTVSSEGGEQTQHCQNTGFSEIALGNRMVITYEKKLIEPADSFSCYLYAELKSRWDPPDNLRWPEPEPKTWPLKSNEVDFLIELNAEDMKTLVPPSDLGDENGLSRRSWHVLAPRSSGISISCHFTDKPPHPLTMQVVPCHGQFTVLTETRRETFHCSMRAFTISPNFFYPFNSTIFVHYENPRGPAENFVCHIYSEVPKLRKKKRPYRKCDQVFNFNVDGFGLLKLQNHLKPSQCRYTLVAPEDKKISLKCIAPPELEENECFGRFVLESFGQIETIECFNKAFSRVSLSNFMTVMFNSTKQDPSRIPSLPPFLCRASVHKNDDECEDCRIAENFKDPKWDHIKTLTWYEVNELRSPKYPNGVPAELTYRWTVVALSGFQVELSCEPYWILSRPEVVRCDGIITVFTEGQNPTVHCSSHNFTRKSLNNRLTFVFVNKKNWDAGPFECKLIAHGVLTTKPPPLYILNATLESANLNIPLFMPKNGQMELRSPNYPYLEPAGSSSRWTVIAEGSRIRLSCLSFENDQEEFCDATLSVRSTSFHRTYCHGATIALDSIKDWMIVAYENRSPEPSDSFTCHVNTDQELPSIEPPDNLTETSPLPYIGCDHMHDMNIHHYTELKLEKDTPGTACRWTFFSTPDTRILLFCPFNKATKRGSCNSLFTIFTPGRETHYCRNENFAKFSTNEWITITYRNPSLTTIEPFKCYVYTEKILNTLISGADPTVDKLDYQSCDASFYLTEPGVQNELTSPNYPNEITPGMPCRWTVYTPRFTSVSLSCLDLTPDDSQGDDTCKGYFTIYETGPLGDPIFRCRHAPFSANSRDNHLIITYSNQFGLSTKPFKCFVSIVDATCRDLIPLPPMPYNSYHTLTPPYWVSTVPPWPSCLLTITSPPETQIYLICGFTGNSNDTMMISTTAAEEFPDAKVRSLDTPFMEVSVKNEMTLQFNVAETTKYSPTGCRIFVDKEEQLEECNCGNKFRKGIPSAASTNSRIINGTETLPNEFPMMAALLNNGKLLCGATIISDLYALTAAHCLAGRENWIFYLAVGAHNIPKGDYISLLVNFRAVHPFYVSGKYSRNYDIGIVGVESPMHFNEKVSPVCLPFKNANIGPGEKVIHLGWGRTRDEHFYDALSGYIFSNILSDVLLQIVDGEIIGDFECEELENNLCTRFKGRGLCHGDSGGPVLWKDPITGLLKLVGVIYATRNKTCEAEVNESRLSYQAEVSYHLNWIEETLPNVTFCKTE